VVDCVFALTADGRGVREVFDVFLDCCLVSASMATSCVEALRGRVVRTCNFGLEELVEAFVFAQLCWWDAVNRMSCIAHRGGAMVLL
jgi:hypothetical protein